MTDVEAPGTPSGPTAERPVVTLADIEAAAATLDGVTRRTPVEPCRILGERIGSEVWLKCEHRQRTGSFKLRGAYTRLSRMGAQERARGVVAASAGNHAQGVALASSLLGITARVFMPNGAPLPKVEATRAYGAEVELSGQSVDDALVTAAEYAERTGAVLVHPFDHPDVIAGQGTLGLELLDQCPAARTVVVPIGGGGLISGVACALRAHRPDVHLVGVQAVGAAAFPPSLAAGRPMVLGQLATMADGIAVARPGRLTFAIVRDLVDEVVTVEEEHISRALLLLLERAKSVVEPAGAVGVAALLDEQVGPRLPGPVAVVLSGGNIDPLLLLRVIRHGMSAAGRYLQLRLHLPDRPGALAALLALLAEQGANVLEVEHVRSGPRMSVHEVELGLRLETLGHRHSAQVLAVLDRAGYPLILG
jgi:threonine dehydratase